MAIIIDTAQINAKYLGGQALNKIMLGVLEIFPNIDSTAAWSPKDLFGPTDPGVWYQYYLTPEQQVWLVNLFTYTEDLTNTAAWSPNAVAVTDGYADPFGGMTATKITSDETWNTHGISYGLITVRQSGDTVTMSVKAKADVSDEITFNAWDGVGVILVTFNLTNGTSNSTWGTSTIVPLGDGWYDCQATGVANNISTTYIFLGEGGSNDPRSIYVCQPQMEFGAIATPYQPISTPEQSFLNAFPDAHLYQDLVGITPVFALNQPIGLCLDQSQGMTLGAELVTNTGPFTNTTGWTDQQGNAPLTVVSGALHATPTTTGASRTDTAIQTNIGKWYKLDVNMAQYSGPGPTLAILQSSNGAIVPGTSAYTFVGPVTIFFVAVTNTTYLTFGSNISTIGVPNILVSASIKEIAGNHWTAASAAARPLYGLIDGGPAVGAIGDGIDDAGNSPVIDLPAIAQAFAGIYAERLTGVPSIVMEYSLDTNNGLGGFYFAAPLNPTKLSFTTNSGGINAEATSSGHTAPDKYVLTGLSDIQNSITRLSINGVPAAESLVTVGTVREPDSIFVFARNNYQLFFQGAITDVVVIGRTTTPLETTNTEDFINDNLGAF